MSEQEKQRIPSLPPPHLGKLQQLRARVPRRRQNDLRVDYASSRILAVDVRRRFYIHSPRQNPHAEMKSRPKNSTRLRLIERQVLPQLAGLFLELGGEGLPARQGVLELLLALIRQPLLGFERLSVDVLTALAGLPS